MLKGVYDVLIPACNAFEAFLMADFCHKILGAEKWDVQRAYKGRAYICVVWNFGNGAIV